MSCRVAAAVRSCIRLEPSNASSTTSDHAIPVNASTRSGGVSKVHHRALAPGPNASRPMRATRRA